ncbi:MAG: hypothetical protein WAN11_14355 [Syntrophobacteraceae bacterium]
MSLKSATLPILAVVFAFTLVFGALAQAQQTRVDRDFGSHHRYDTNQFGDDRAYTSPNRGTDKDSDSRLDQWRPNSYGLGGDYWYDSR